MYHIFLPTPLVNNSNFVPHLLEHIVLSCHKERDKYFFVSRLLAENYTYYTSFSLPSDSKQEELDRLFQYIQCNISFWTYLYEKKILWEELKEQKYFHWLISRIGKKMYGKTFSYSSLWNTSFMKLQKYHQMYYQRKNFLVIPDWLITKDILLQGFSLQSFTLAYKWVHEYVVITNYTHESLMALSLLEELFDAYLEYHERYEAGKYYFNDVLQWEFSDYVFLSVDVKYIKILEKIPSVFIEWFIQQKCITIQEVSPNIDGPLMLQYGYSLSWKSKSLILTHLEKYYKLWLIENKK